MKSSCGGTRARRARAPAFKEVQGGLSPYETVKFPNIEVSCGWQ